MVKHYEEKLMPIYEYRCPKCRHEKEIRSLVPLEVICKKCGSFMKRIISKSNFILKWKKN